MENNEDVNPTVAGEDKKLKKELSFVQLLFLSIGGIIGSGWLFGVNAGAATAGPAVTLSWLIGGVMVIFIALTYSELAAMIPRSGAIVRYPHMTHGSYTGYILGWAYLLSAVTVPSIEAVAAVTYISGLKGLGFMSYSGTTVLGSFTSLTVYGVMIAVLLMIGFFFLNYFGIKFLGRWNEYFVYWKLIIPTITFILLFFMFRASNFTALPGGFNAIGTPFIFTAIPGAGIVFSYLGFRQALDYGGEAKNPQRDIPRALILSVVIGIIVYEILQLVYIGAIRVSVADLTTFSWSGLTVSSYASSPFYHVFETAGIAGFGAWGSVLLADAVISPSGTGWIYLGTSTRTIYGLATDKYFPPSVMKVRKKSGVPMIPLILSTIIGIIFIAPFPSWYILVAFISSATVFTYIMGGVSLRVLRNTAKNVERPYKLPYSRVLSIIAFISATLIVYWSGYITLSILMMLILGGIPVYLIYYGTYKLGISLGKTITSGLIFWIIIGISFYLLYYDIIIPAVANITASTPLAAPDSVFYYFIAVYIMIVVSTIVLTFLIHHWAKDENKKEIKSGWWLIYFVLFIFGFSYLGAFGPYVSPIAVAGQSFPYVPLLLFPYDTFIVIVVAIAFFFFAVRSGYSEDDVQSILADQGVPLSTLED